MNDNDHIKISLPGESLWAKILHNGPPLIIEIVSTPISELHRYEKGDRLQMRRDEDGRWIPI